MTDEAKTKEEGAKVTKEQRETASLSAKDIRYRERHNNTVAEFEQYKIAAEKEKETLSSTVTNLSKEQQMVKDRYIDAEMKAAAVAAGITDADLVKLIAKDKIAIGDDFSVTGTEEAVQEFKAKKPHFFGTEKKVASSTNAKVPEKEVVTKVYAKDLTDGDFELKMRQLKSGQRL